MTAGGDHPAVVRREPPLARHTYLSRIRRKRVQFCRCKHSSGRRRGGADGVTAARARECPEWTITHGAVADSASSPRTCPTTPSSPDLWRCEARCLWVLNRLSKVFAFVVALTATRLAPARCLFFATA
jgi:hypothetical protein